MTQTALGRFVWPEIPIAYDISAASLAGSTVTFDSTADRVAWVGTYYGDADSIASVKFRVGTIAASAGTGVKLRIESVTNGKPSGSLWSANGTGAAPSASVTIADTDDDTFKTATLTNAANLVAGDQFAIVIVYEAGNDDGTFSVQFPSSGIQAPFYPMALSDNGVGTWVHRTTAYAWIVTMTNAGVTHFPALAPVRDGAYVSVNNSAAADERALRFQLPVPVTVVGARAFVGNISAGADFMFALWSSSGDQVGEELAQTLPLDGDFQSSTTRDGYVELAFTAPYEIAANTTYYLGIKSTAAANAQLGQFTVDDASYMAAFPTGATAAECYLAVRTWDESTTPDSAGAWTTSTTVLPLIQLVISKIDDGAGSGGGGMRLAGHGGLAA